MRILVIEDCGLTALTLRRVLVRGGFEIAVAYTGSEGVARARQFRPDVVLCDIGLPDLDGYAVAAALRQDLLLAGVRLIAISGYGDDEDPRRSRAAGFERYLAKPLDLADLHRLLAATPEATAI